MFLSPINKHSNEPVSDTALQFLADAEKEHHRKIVANIVQQIKPRVKELHSLLVNPPPVSDTQHFSIKQINKHSFIYHTPKSLRCRDRTSRTL